MLSSDDAFDLFEKIAQVGGHSKQSLLHGQDVSVYLLAAYDPHVRYHLTNCKKGEGQYKFSSESWRVLGKLSERTITGNDAQVIANIITEEMTPKSAELFKRILNKDLRIGMGAKTINKVFPGLIPVHDIMLAKTFNKDKIEFPCFGSPKIDGIRAIFKNNRFYSRKGHVYNGLQHLSEELKEIYTELDGELTVPGKTFQESSGLIRNNDFISNAVFDIFELPKTNLPFIQRLTAMKDLHLIGPHIFRVQHSVLTDIDEVLEYYINCRSAGYEGSVIKPYDYEYKGTRSWDWMKMKQILSADLDITNVFEGKGKYKGMLGGIIVAFNGKPNEVGSGFDDYQRKLFWNNPEEIIGKCAEVLYTEETDDGNMRHSRFLEIREDK